MQMVAMLKLVHRSSITRENPCFYINCHVRNQAKGRRCQGTTVIIDENIFNLDGADGFACFWHDLRKEAESFSKRKQGGDSVMVCGAVSYFGTVELSGIKGIMNAEQYWRVLCDDL